MKVAVIGSRGLWVPDLEKYLPPDTDMLISGGAKGVDSCIRAYAAAHGIPLTEYLPDYRRYGRGAPLKRNVTIAENAELVLAFWDGRSRETRFVIEFCEKNGIPLRVFFLTADGHPP